MDYVSDEGMSQWVEDVEAVAAEVVEAAAAFQRVLMTADSSPQQVEAVKDAVGSARREMERVLTSRLAVVSSREGSLRGLGGLS